MIHANLVHSVSKHRCHALKQYREIDRRIVNVNDLPKRSTGRTAITHETLCEIFVHASLSINEHEKFFLNKGKWEIGSASKF